MKQPSLKSIICFGTLLLALNIRTNAATYYVSNSGDDSFNGLSELKAWKSIEHINKQSFSPGDSVLFRRGDIWRNSQLRVPSSGTESEPVVFSAYSTGSRPEIRGSLKASNWEKVSGNIWVSATQISVDPWSLGYDGPEIFFENSEGSVSWGIHQSYTANHSSLTKEFHWTWSANKIYIYSPSDPNTRYNSVEVPQLALGIMLLNKNYITIDGLAIKYYGDAGICDEYQTIVLNGLRVTRCEIAYIGKKDGSSAYGLSVHHSNSYYAYNEIHNCGRRGISLTLYTTTPITQSNVIIEHNHFHHGWHTTSLDCSTIGGHTIENIYFRNNRVDGDPSVELNGVNPNSNHIFCDNQSGGTGTIRNLYFYNNIFTWAHASSIKIGDIGNVYIYHNTFYNFNPTLANWQAHCFLSATPSQIEVKNNIFYNNATDNRWADIEIQNGYQHLFDIQNNLYFHLNSATRVFWVDQGTSYSAANWNSYVGNTGYDTKSPAPADPLFIEAPANFGLGTGSPAIGKAVPITLVKTDFYGNPMNNPPDIGAIQFGSKPSAVRNPGRQTTFNNPFTVYPNPAKNSLSVAFTGDLSSTCSLSVYNMLGMRVYEEEILPGSREINLSLGGFAPGVYVIVYLNEGKHFTQKFLVE
ncbi:MAG: T9SS type A sorting domain-containing protein [Bacteroidales bacterium]|nr:T9SS type A sorting domain-containing protein [Bacteroidales bacterium]